MSKVTYTPLENGDPLMTTFGGYHFRNGEPVEIPDSATIVRTFREETSKSSDGEPRYKGVDRNVPLIEVLKANPYFKIDGVEAPARAKPGRPRVPKTPDEYRAYAMEWFGRMDSHTELGRRWKDEAELRERLDVHDDGEIVEYLRPFYEARYHDLKKAA